MDELQKKTIKMQMLMDDELAAIVARQLRAKKQLERQIAHASRRSTQYGMVRVFHLST